MTVGATHGESALLDAVLDSWDRANAIMLNLHRALPTGGLEARLSFWMRKTTGGRA